MRKVDWEKVAEYGSWFVGVILVCFFLFVSFKSCTEKEETEERNKSLESENIDLNRDLANVKDSISLYKEMYEKCAGILTPEEENKILKQKIIELENKKPVIIIKKVKEPAPASISTPAAVSVPDISETKFDDNFTPSPTVTPEENNLVITEYQGEMKGDYGITTEDKAGKIVYFLKSTFVKNGGSTETPRLNGPNGAKFSYNAETGYWYYIDGQIVTTSEINSWAYAKEWNVYIGKTDYGVGSYDTYLPHQLLKPLINQVRGKEWGEITDEELVKMRKVNPNIWTPTSEGTLRPFRLNSTAGRAYGKEDNQLYQGWNFRTKVTAIKRVTSK